MFRGHDIERFKGVTLFEALLFFFESNGGKKFSGSFGWENSFLKMIRCTRGYQLSKASNIQILTWNALFAIRIRRNLESDGFSMMFSRYLPIVSMAG